MTYPEFFQTKLLMQLANTVSPSESLARYLTSSKHYGTKMQVVKPAAFLPQPPDYCLSVFRIDGLTTEQVCQIGQEKVINKRPERTLHGFANIVAQAFLDANLAIDPDNNPPRHASVVGWPKDKPQQISIAQELAASAMLVACSR
jgi:hypothetical protein